MIRKKSKNELKRKRIFAPWDTDARKIYVECAVPSNVLSSASFLKFDTHCTNYWKIIIPSLPVFLSHKLISTHPLWPIISIIFLVQSLRILLTLRAGNHMVKQSTLFFFHPRSLNSFHPTPFIMGPMPSEEILAKSPGTYYYASYLLYFLLSGLGKLIFHVYILTL